MKKLLPLLMVSTTALANPASRLLTGKVVGPDGAPVPKAGVFITTDFWDPDNKAVAERFPDRTYDTGTDGSFVVTSPGESRPGVKLLRLRAVAHAEGFSSSDEIVSVPEGAKSYAPAVIHLRPGVAVQIVVVDGETGAPIANATVTPPRFGTETIVKADGLAVFPGRDDRSHDEFAIAATGYQLGGVAPDFAKQVQRAPLRRLWPLQIRILDLEGKPLAGCRVSIGAEARVTDRDGGFQVLAPHGEVQLVPICRQNFDQPTVAQHVGTGVHEIRLRPNLVVVGQVVGPKHKPIAGVRVAVRPEHEISRARPMALAEVTTDADGRFRFDSFYAERFMLAVEDGKFSSPQVAVVAKSMGAIVLVATANP